MAKDIFEMPPLAAAIEEQEILSQQEPENFDFIMLPPLGQGGNEYIV